MILTPTFGRDHALLVGLVLKGLLKMKSILALAIVAILACSEGCYAQTLVKPEAAAPDFRVSVIERREEHTTVECDKKADEAKVRRKDRFSFFEQCLIGGAKTSK
jgi:hypothetical protein